MAGFQNTLTAVTAPSGSTGRSSGGGGYRGVSNTNPAIQGVSQLVSDLAPMAQAWLQDKRLEGALEPFTKLQEAREQTTDSASLLEISTKWKQAELNLLKQDPELFESVTRAFGGSTIAAQRQQENARYAGYVAEGRARNPDKSMSDEEAYRSGFAAEQTKIKLAADVAQLKSAEGMTEDEIKTQKERGTRFGSMYFDTVFSETLQGSLSEFRKNIENIGELTPELFKEYQTTVSLLGQQVSTAERRLNDMMVQNGTHSDVTKSILESYQTEAKNIISGFSNLKDSSAVSNYMTVHNAFEKKLGLDFMQSAKLLSRFTAIPGAERAIGLLATDQAMNILPQLKKGITEYLNNGLAHVGGDPVAQLTKMIDTINNKDAISNLSEPKERVQAIGLAQGKVRELQSTSGPLTLGDAEGYGNLTSNLGFGLSVLSTHQAKRTTLETLSSPEHAKRLSELQSFDRNAVTGVTSGGLLKTGFDAIKNLKAEAADPLSRANIQYNSDTGRLTHSREIKGFIERTRDVNRKTAYGSSEPEAVEIAAEQAVEQLNLAREAYVIHAQYDPNLKGLSEKELGDAFFAQLQTQAGYEFSGDLKMPKQLTTQQAQAGIPATFKELIAGTQLELQGNRQKLQEGSEFGTTQSEVVSKAFPRIETASQRVLRWNK